MPNGTYGGVRGRKTKVGRKLLRFPPTRLSLGIDFHSGEFFDAPLWNLRCVIVRFTWNFFLSAYA